MMPLLNPSFPYLFLGEVGSPADPRAAWGSLTWAEVALWAAVILAGLVLAVTNRLVRTARGRRIADEIRRFTGGEPAEWSALREGASALLYLPHTPDGHGIPVALCALGTRYPIARMEGSAVRLPGIGVPVTVCAPTESATLIFRSVVADRRAVEGSALVALQRPPWLARVQRRDYHRVAVRLPAVIREMGKADSASVRAMVRDLSAGGCRIALSNPIPEGARIAVRAALVPGWNHRFEARVVSCRLDLRPGSHFVVQCTFEGLDSSMREWLVNYCFDVERAQRRASHLKG